MGLIKRIYLRWRAHKLRCKAKNDLHEMMFTSPTQFIRANNEIDCIINGHKWDSEFDPKKEISKNVKDRTYCAHCGVYYHEHVYKPGGLMFIRRPRKKQKSNNQ